MSHNYYPKSIDQDTLEKNPAFQVFGNRFFSDQTVSELLVEFLLVAFSPKRFGVDQTIEEAGLIPFEQLEEGPGQRFMYAPKARLNLKLFSFLGVTRLDARHQTHREHHAYLIEKLKERIQSDGAGSEDDIIRTIENLLLGFQGAGSGRTWTAQSFIPIAEGFLAAETIWRETEAKKSNLSEWSQLTLKPSRFFDYSKRLFLARGGELLYLQICNALRQPAADIAEWNQKESIGLSKDECKPSWLHKSLDETLKTLMQQSPRSLTELAEFIDAGLDPETPQSTDQAQGGRRFVKAGWCNAESWREGYLFAVELLRILSVKMDVVERIYLLETACAMQALRTLGTQSVRAAAKEETPGTYPGYYLIVTDPDETHAPIKRLSHQSMKNMEKAIFKALRGAELILPEDDDKRETTLKRADKSYGSKLFTGLSKRLGFIVPKRGPGARFVLNEHLMRLLVITSMPADVDRITYDTFKELLQRRYGLVFDAKGMEQASRHINGRSTLLPGDTDAWLQHMLEASGFLIHLSDSCAMIQNPAKS